MLQYCGISKGSIIVGSSVHNQHIEYINEYTLGYNILMLPVSILLVRPIYKYVSVCITKRLKVSNLRLIKC